MRVGFVWIAAFVFCLAAWWVVLTLVDRALELSINAVATGGLW